MKATNKFQEKFAFKRETYILSHPLFGGRSYTYIGHIFYICYVAMDNTSIVSCITGIPVL